jgi:hypothetical protein
MKVKKGAVKINDQGGAVFIHKDRRKESEIAGYIAANPTQAPLAPIEVRDYVYSKLIHLSPATRYPSALIAGDKGLAARGLSEQHLNGYGGLPAESRERDRIARQLLKEVKQRFPQISSLRGVPGFWENSDGPHLSRPKDYLFPTLLIPARDEQGRIQACQMRLTYVSKKGMRYLWLSSSDLPYGTGSGGPLHYKFRLADLPHDAKIMIIEGLLKADVFVALRPSNYVVGTPSVTTNHASLIELTHGREALIAFDQDSYTNETVFFHLAGLVAKRWRREGTLKTTYIVSWDAEAKGIDDAALRKINIKAIKVSSWFRKLSPHFQEIATERFSEITAGQRWSYETG